MAEANQVRTKITGFELAMKVWHPKKSKPVLCLHGKLDNAASYDLLAPHLPDRELIALDLPGTGFSSHYPKGILPWWKNDSLLLLELINTLSLKEFDIVAHSFGSLHALFIAITKKEQVGKLVFLDIFGPRVDFQENAIINLQREVDYLLESDQQGMVFPDMDTLIKDRMKRGNISYQAARALASRGVTECEGGVQWTFDRRLHCTSMTLPHEDELRTMLKALQVPVCLIQAEQGIRYPQEILQKRAEYIANLTIHKVKGGHHVHMDDPAPVAKIISNFL